jgi:hypothetical protein
MEEILELIEEKKMNLLHERLEDMNSADFPALFEELEEEKIRQALVKDILGKREVIGVQEDKISELDEQLGNKNKGPEDPRG